MHGSLRNTSILHLKKLQRMSPAYSTGLIPIASFFQEPAIKTARLFLEVSC